jgi:hypothetical protein
MMRESKLKANHKDAGTAFTSSHQCQPVSRYTILLGHLPLCRRRQQNKWTKPAQLLGESELNVITVPAPITFLKDSCFVHSLIHPSIHPSIHPFILNVLLQSAYLPELGFQCEKCFLFSGVRISNFKSVSKENSPKFL